MNSVSTAIETLASSYGLNPLHILEQYLERAAIMEFDGGMTRAEAERLAMVDIESELTRPVIAASSEAL